MGGSHRTKASRFLDLARTKHETAIRDMERVYSTDPTPALRQKIESKQKLLKKLEHEHERFERLMSISDGELQAMNSNERSEDAKPIFGDPELVRKHAERRYSDEEYFDLTDGPTLIIKRQK